MYKNVAELFEEQVKKTPDNIAVVFDNEKLTYGDLNARANALSHKLRELGVKPDDFVAVIADRSIEMICGIYGIIKSGGAYVPIDPSYPSERIRFILEDCRPKAVLKYTDKTVLLPTEIQLIDLAESSVMEGVTENAEIVNKTDDLLYCIYTSGTTGTPKGVMIEHGGIANLGRYMQDELDIAENDHVMMFANFIFDGSVWEIMMAHINGATLFIPDDETIRDI